MPRETATFRAWVAEEGPMTETEERPAREGIREWSPRSHFRSCCFETRCTEQ